MIMVYGLKMNIKAIYTLLMQMNLIKNKLKNVTINQLDSEF